MRFLQDQRAIETSEVAVIIAVVVLVALFMIARYGLFGVFADIALALNIVLLMAALTLFNIPGISGTARIPWKKGLRIV